MKVKAINPCIMEHSDLPALTVGKVYDASFTRTELVIIDDDQEEHYFDRSNFDEYFVMIDD